MTMRIFGDSLSGNCLKVKWTAQKLALPFEWVELSVLTGDTRRPDFLAINPAGQVPAAQWPDGRALAQSNAIIAHIAEGSALIPTDPFERAKMFEWMFWEQYSHEPYIAVARFQMAYLGKSKSELDPKLHERGAAALSQMEAYLNAHEFLAGDALSLADIALVAYSRVAPEGGFDLAAYPALRVWIARIEAALNL